ncbi:MAG: GNAT family N-acetyltransferase [Candidatus Eisenbacteria bacterium]|uniref:GNAT family N-acetyltransferase n=1 Tax=Eiseniibacteriota bacterium TaxID=2212470 RepID=A0A538UAG6_UNCEI|nr:MAG: GNAT family N-acetyltransferase [Candidatus Eisenbacteria bacterium]
MLTIEQVESPAQIAAVQDLLREYMEWTETLSTNQRQAPTFAGWDEEFAALPGIYAPPRGRLLLATHDGWPVGCVALKPREDEVCELKRLYVRPGFRGLEVGRWLVAAVVQAARDLGERRMVLDSHVSMTPAHALYEAIGFERVPTPADFPESLKPLVVFMELDLARARA